MATNEVFAEADHLSLPVASGVVSGDPVIVGSLLGVAQTDRDDDGNASVCLTGAHLIPVAGAVTAVGTPVYITSGGTLTATTTGNTLFGYALATKSATTAPLLVRVSRV